jgi:hypothetical protein
MFSFLLTTYAWGALGGYWVARLLARFLIVGWRRFTTRPSLPFVIAPLLFVLTAALVLFGVAGRMRFEASRTAMEELVSDVLNGENVPATTRVGLYRVTDVERVPDGVRFLVEGTGFIDRYGFIYSPDGHPKKRGVFRRYWHMDGPWWVVEEQF